MKIRMNLYNTCLVFAIGLPGVSIQAAITFSEDFEDPVVSGYSQTTLPATGWVGANQGFGGNRHGLNNEDDGLFTTPYGEQGYRLNYTNSGLTTEEGAIGNLRENTQYTITFNTAIPSTATSSGYRLELLAFNGVPNSSRNDARSIPAGATLLSFVNGTVSTTDFSESVQLTFNAGPGHPNDGQDLGIRLIKQSGVALYDNIKFNDAGVGSYVPEPSTAITMMLGASLLGFFRRLRYESDARKSVTRSAA